MAALRRRGARRPGGRLPQRMRPRRRCWSPRRWLPTAPDAAPALTLADLDAATPAGAPVPDPRAAGLTPDHPAYLIYTSGSTGVPKGIVISHANICHFLRSGNALYGMRADDVVFQGASVAFDLSMEEIWVPYLVGATPVRGEPGHDGRRGVAARHPGGGADHGARHRADPAGNDLGRPADGAPRPARRRGPARAAGRPLGDRARQLFNTYGPTEATVVATAAEMRPGEPVTIGGPIPNYSVYVAGRGSGLLGRDQQGELLIGGPGVARGYLARPELTAEKFIANPFASDGADPILYRSGDAVSLDAAGRIVFHGRIDDQVKIRGFRVELGEIEARIRSVPDINQAAVVLRQDDGVDRLVAFLIPERGRSVGHRRPAADPRRPDAALHGARPLRAGRDPAAADLRQGRPQGPEDRAAHRGGRRRRAGGAGQRDRGGPGRGGQAGLRQPADPAGGRFLRRPRRPLAAGRPLRLGGPRDAGARRHHPAGRLRPAHHARNGRRADRPHRRHGGGGRHPGPELRAATAAAPGPVRVRATRGAALRHRARHGAVARDVRDLPAAHRRRPRLLRRTRRAAAGLRRHQRRHRGHRGGGQVADPRPDQARSLPALGRVLLSLVAGAASRAARPREMAAGLAGDRRLPSADGCPGRPRHPDLRRRDRRARPADHRRRRLPGRPPRHRQRRDRRQRAGHRHGGDRCRRGDRHLLRDQPRHGDRPPGRDRGSHHDPGRIARRGRRALGRVTRPQGRDGRSRRTAGRRRGLVVAPGRLPGGYVVLLGAIPRGGPAADLPGLLHLRPDLGLARPT